jgi:O-succinylbenzoate synthase
MSGVLRLSAARWSLPLRGAPAIGALGPLTVREGLLLALERDGRWGLGEAAPLPGLSSESLADVEQALSRWRALPDEEAAHATDRLPPSLAMGLEAARLDLVADDAAPPSLRTSLLAGEEQEVSRGAQAQVARGVLTPAPFGVDPSHPASDRRAVLLGERGEERFESTTQATQTGVGARGRIVKLKVGRRPLAEECARVAAFAAAGVRLRLDGNRRLDRDAARALVAAAGDALDYFEEPGPGLTSSALAAPVALDETIDDVCARLAPEDDSAAIERALSQSDAAVWVVKPTIFGPRRTRQLARLAQGRGVRVVLSSAYDGSVGRRGLVRLGSELGLSSTVHGLGTGGLFASDLEARPGPVVVEEGSFLKVGAPLSPASFPDLDWRETGS